MKEAPAAGARVGLYRIERLLGRGGMGEVWLAHDEALDRPVALKLIAGDVASDPERRLRFLEETRLAASLDHPHIVPIYASGEADGRLYLAMRYVEGSDLEGIIGSEGPLDPGRVIGLLRGIADALDAAHERGLVHRDVKPGNVLVTRTAAGEHAYLTDFGLAKRLQGGTSLDGGRLVGSIGFVAPELIDGLPVDGRADVYSLGCTLYAALAGRSPFARETEPAALLAHLEGRIRPLAEDRPALAPLDPVVAASLARDPADRPSTAGEVLRAAAAAIDRPVDAWTATGGKADIELPYVGLRAFEEADARFYVGREDEVDALLGRLREGRFLAVFGPSGSGKSSLVRAGLVPALRAGRIAGSESWPLSVLRPGALPLEALATRLVALRPGPSMASTVDDLATDPRTLHLATELALADADPSARLVWVVDQAEELFTLVADDDARTAVIANLVHAATAPGGRTIVVLAMRADFYPRCAAYPELAALVAGYQTLVSPMSTAQLERTIVEPARMVGLELEPGLVETILDDVVDRPGALPLLEHLLFELWDRRRGATLTLAGYRECGGIEGAIAVRAEATYGALSPDDQAIARQAFLRLVQPGDGTEDTRRRAAVRELGAAAEPVLEQLASARLVTLATSEADGTPVVDIAHEALLRAWPRLRDWIDEDRGALRTSRRIAEGAAEWIRLGRERDALLVGARLLEADELLRDRPGMLTDDEQAYIGASLADRERRIRDTRRRQRLVVGVSLGLAAFFLVLSAVAFTSWRQSSADRDAAIAAGNDAAAARDDADAKAAQADDARKEAEARRAEAEAERLTSLTRQLIAQSLQHDDDPVLATLLAVAASTVSGPETTADAKANVLTALNLTPSYAGRLQLVPPGEDGTIAEMRASPDGSRIAAVITANGTDPRLFVWDVGQTASTASVPRVVFGPVPVAGNAGFALSSDGTMLVYVDPHGTLTVFDLDHGGQPTTGPSVDPESSSQVRFDADGTSIRWLASERQEAAGLPSDGPRATTQPVPRDTVFVSFWSLSSGSVSEFAISPTVGSRSKDSFTYLAPDGPYAFRVGISDGGGPTTVDVFNADTRRLVGTSGNVVGVGRDGRTLVEATDSDAGKILTVRRLPSLARVGHPITVDLGSDDKGITALADTDQSRVIVMTQDVMQVYNLDDGSAISSTSLPDHDPELVAITDAGDLLVGDGRAIGVVDPDRLNPVERSGRLALPFDWRTTLTFISADGSSLTTLPLDESATTASVTDAATGVARTIEIPGLAGGYDRYALPDGNSIVQLVASGRLVITSLVDGSRRELPEIAGMRDDLAEAERQQRDYPRLLVTQAGDFVAVATAGRTVIVGMDGTVRSFDVVLPRSPRPLLLPGATEVVIAECDDAGSLVQRIELQTGAPVASFRIPGCPVTMTLDHAGSTAIVAFPGQLTIVDLATFEPMGSIAIGEEPFSLRMVDPGDGTRLLRATTSSGPDLNLRLRSFALDGASVHDAACRSAGRNLTPAEWSQYLGDLPYVDVCPGYPAAAVAEPATSPAPVSP